MTGERKKNTHCCLDQETSLAGFTVGTHGLSPHPLGGSTECHLSPVRIKINEQHRHTAAASAPFHVQHCPASGSPGDCAKRDHVPSTSLKKKKRFPGDQGRARCLGGDPAGLGTSGEPSCVSGSLRLSLCPCLSVCLFLLCLSPPKAPPKRGALGAAPQHATCPFADFTGTRVPKASRRRRAHATEVTQQSPSPCGLALTERSSPPPTPRHGARARRSGARAAPRRRQPRPGCDRGPGVSAWCRRPRCAQRVVPGALSRSTGPGGRGAPRRRHVVLGLQEAPQNVTAPATRGTPTWGRAAAPPRFGVLPTPRGQQRPEPQGQRSRPQPAPTPALPSSNF